MALLADGYRQVRAGPTTVSGHALGDHHAMMSDVYSTPGSYPEALQEFCGNIYALFWLLPGCLTARGGGIIDTSWKSLKDGFFLAVNHGLIDCWTDSFSPVLAKNSITSRVPPCMGLPIVPSG